MRTKSQGELTRRERAWRDRLILHGIKPARRPMKLCVCGKPHYAKGLCKTCWGREWRKANPDKVKAQTKKYRQNHHKELAEASRKWRMSHPNYQRPDYKRKTCEIIKQHAFDLKDDPERLSTVFIQNLIGIKCKKEKL